MRAVDLIRKKRDGGELSAQEISAPAVKKKFPIIFLALLVIFSQPARSGEAPTPQKRYFAYPAFEDSHGVIAPWYTRQNGQCDFRVRIAAETLKRYPWVALDRAVAIAPEYAFNSTWRISPDGTITVPKMNDWTCGDRSQMCARVLFAWIEYYRYSGDPAALAHIDVVANTLLDFNQTDKNHPWPNFLISVPVKGKPYARADSGGWIQLDIVAEAGLALLRSYEVIGERRLLDQVKHWADVFAEKRNRNPGAPPWPRFANPEQVKRGKNATDNIQTGGLVYQLAMLDELIRLGYTGERNGIVEARDAGRGWLRASLLPAWAVNDTWGRNYWDWEDPVQAQTTTDWAARYLMDNPNEFPNWRNDVRNILTLFLNHTSVALDSSAGVYSGAWAFPESSGCCGRSLAWGPLELAMDFAQYGVQANSEWGRELARRQEILATYDAHETGVVEDNIDGGQLAAGAWLKSAHPSALEWVLRAMSWLPEQLGPNRENHIMRSSAVVNSVTYGKGKITWSTFDAPENTVDVLRLSFEPRSITAGGKALSLASSGGEGRGEEAPSSGRVQMGPNLFANGYTVKRLPDGDFIVCVRHDGKKDVIIKGNDPQVVADFKPQQYQGTWTTHRRTEAVGGRIHTTSESGASATVPFKGNQVRLIGSVGPEGGLADVFLDGIKQLVGIDFWNPRSLHQQMVYYKNGLTAGEHTLTVMARDQKNPLSQGNQVTVEAVQSSAAEGRNNFGEGSGPTNAQRMIFGYTSPMDYVDKHGYAWRPATEFVVRTGSGTDSVAKSWWTTKRTPSIEGTDDPDLYQYGVHAPEFVADITVGPGRYGVRLLLAETEYAAPGERIMTIHINGEKVAEQFDVIARAGKPNKAFDLVCSEVTPKNGIIEIHFTGGMVKGAQCEAMVQAVEVTPAQR